MMREDQEYWQRLRKDRRSNWAVGMAAIASISATVSLTALLVDGSQYQARGNPLYWLLMLPVVWWLSSLGSFEPRAVRWWKPALLTSVAIATLACFMAVGKPDWGPTAFGLGVTLLSASLSAILLRGSLVAREGPAR